MAFWAIGNSVSVQNTSSVTPLGLVDLILNKKNFSPSDIFHQVVINLKHILECIKELFDLKLLENG